MSEVNQEKIPLNPNEPSDRAKLLLINDWEEASKLLCEIEKKRCQTPEVEKFGDEPAFKSKLLKVSRKLKPRLQNYKNDVLITKLLASERKINYSMTLKQAIAVYDALTYYLELSGITRVDKDFEVGVNPPKFQA
jgi:hypothetical protein